jgi:4-alpha-glucanotransferase
VETTWVGVDGQRHEVPDATLAAILDVLSPGAATSPELGAPTIVATRGAQVAAPAGQLRLEDGGERRVDGALPGDLPLGYHRLHGDDGVERAVVIGPGRCHLPAGLRTWGWAVQLYAVHSQGSWGMGDLGDLRELAAWSRGLGAGLLLLNPLHHSSPVPPVAPSPYSPGSRRFRDPIWLRVEDVPGAAGVLGGAAVEALARAAREAAAGGRIDRDAVLRAKLAALGEVWAATPRPPEAFAAWRDEQGQALRDFGTWCALAEGHGPAWREWPAELRDRRSPAVAAAAASLADRAGFHAWLQWLVDGQVAAAQAELPLLHDLAIGVDPGGVDAWLQPEVLASGVHVGAPPDLFNALGQDWGILPFDPRRLRAADYQPFVEVVRAAMRGGGGLRVDHVMGLSRLYWVPPGGSPAEGAYVRYPAADLFELLALESVRAEAVVVGEDLGTVEPAVREQMAARDVLSYTVLWFEDRPPEEWPERALAAVTTHDLPTVAGLWSGSDLRDQQRAGTAPDAAGNAALRERLRRLGGLAATAPPSDAVEAAYAALARSPSALLVATLEDALAVERRPNLPGTTAERWPSWSVPLPRTLEELAGEPLALRLAELLGRR